LSLLVRFEALPFGAISILPPSWMWATISTWYNVFGSNCLIIAEFVPKPNSMLCLTKHTVPTNGDRQGYQKLKLQLLTMKSLKTLQTR